MRALCIDLFCGLGGWAKGFLDEGYDVVGFDIERKPYPAQLVLQDVLTLDGSQFKEASHYSDLRVDTGCMVMFRRFCLKHGRSEQRRKRNAGTDEYPGKELMTHTPEERAKIPYSLSRYIASTFKPDARSANGINPNP